MRKVAFVRPTPERRTELTERLECEPLNGRQRRHFQILLAADEGEPMSGAPPRPAPAARRSSAQMGLA